MSHYVKLCKINKEFRHLVLVLIISQLGSIFSQTAIFTLLVNINAPTWAISLSAAMGFIPPTIIAPFSGAFIEKYEKTKLLKLFLGIQLISVLSLLLINSLNDIYLLELLIFLRMGSSAMYFQTEKVLMPKIVAKNELIYANEFHSMIWSATYTIGMSLAGIFIYLFGIKISFIIDFLLFLTSIILINRLDIKEEIIKNSNKIFFMIKEGLTYLFSKKDLLKFVFLHGLIGATSYDALITLLAKNEYKGVISASLAIGFMGASKAFGIAIGPLFLSKFTNKNTIFYIFLAQFLSIVIWAICEFNFYLNLIGLFLTGFFTTTLWSYTFTKIQLICHKNFLGRIVAWIDTFYLSVATISSLLIGKLYEDNKFSLPLITFLLGSIFLFSAFFYKSIKDK